MVDADIWVEIDLNFRDFLVRIETSEGIFKGRAKRIEGSCHKKC